MKKIAWFQDAENDLDDIYEFYYVKNPGVAIRLYNSILDEIELLKSHPCIAATEPLTARKGYKYTFRSLVTKNGLFKVVYFVTDETVVIVRIWCCRKNPQEFPL